MDHELLKKAIIKYISGVILIGLLLFVPSGDFGWKNGWILMLVLFFPMLIVGLIMYAKAPELLRSRLNMKETQNEQKDVIKYSAIMFIGAFIIAGFNYRFELIALPDPVVWAAVCIFLLSYCMFAEVLRENQYLSRVVEVREDQSVVDTGLYGIVRHPMYSATVLLFLSMPLILNSLPSFIIMLAYIPIIVKRIENEEMVLDKELKGYTDYKKKVKYRLLPFIW